MNTYWSNYWKQGYITSFGAELPNNYQGKLSSFWKDVFCHFGKPGSTVVDLGTGNGALIDLGLKYCNNVDIDFIGVDYAKLNISTHFDCASVVFYQNTTIENMPLSDNSADIVISQFGFEYCDVVQGVKEIARILKESGRFIAVIHNSNSSIVKPNLQMLQAAQKLKGDGKPLILLRHLVNNLVKYGVNKPQVEVARKSLNSSIHNWLKDNAEGAAATKFPAFLKAVMAPTVEYKQRKKMIKLFEKELTHQIERLTDLKAAAKSEKELKEIALLLKKVGFSEVKFEPLHEQNYELIGWQLHVNF